MNQHNSKYHLTHLIPISLLSMTEAQLLQEQALEIMEIVEDSVEHYCDNRMVSGEKIWVMIRALCDCKLAEFPFEDDIDEEED